MVAFADDHIIFNATITEYYGTSLPSFLNRRNYSPRTVSL